MTARAEVVARGASAGGLDALSMVLRSLPEDFPARELLARVGAQLELARLRRRDAEMNAFRVQLSDALRAHQDPFEIKRYAFRLLVERLRSDQAHFGELDSESEEFFVEGNYGVPDAFEITGRFPSGAFEPLASQFQAGESVVVEDVETDPRFPPETKASFLALRTRATASFPIMREGEFCALLSVAQYEPRLWTEEDLTLIEEVAGRTWAEVERARAEHALRESEMRYHTLFERME